MTAPVDMKAPDVLRVLAAHRPEFLAFVERRVASRELAEDILQEAFARGADRTEQLRSDDAAVAWFYRVLRNAIVDSHRRRAAADRKVAAFAAEQPSDSLPDDARSPCACVGDLAGSLKPEYADALHRIEVDGVAVKDYAAEAGISSNNAAVRVLRAREALKKQVTRTCGACAARGCVDCTCSHASDD